MGARLRLLLLAVLTVVAAVLGARAGRLAADQPAPVEQAVAPAERPADLLAEVVLPSPDATWRKAQLAIGGAVVLAPATFGGVMAARVGIAELAPLVDGAAPAYGVVDGSGAWVVAARLSNAARARSTVTLPLVERASGIELHADVGRAVGLVGSWVLFGSDRGAITQLGPYAFRTLPRRSLPQSALLVSMDQAALAGPVRTLLEAKLGDLDAYLRRTAREEERARGRAPDLGDTTPFAEALVALGHKYADAVTGMERVDVAADVDDAGIGLRATFVPPAAGASKVWVAGLAAGDTAQLEAASTTAIATVFWHSTEAERTELVRSAVGALPRVLGPRVPAADVTALADAIEPTASARGDWALASVEAQSGAGLALRLAARDAPKLAASVEGAIDALHKPSWARWEQSALHVTRLERKGSSATFTVEETNLTMTWSQRDGELDVAAGVDPAATLDKAFPARGLATDGAVAPWLHSLGPAVVWAAVARPLILGASLRMDPLLVALVRAAADLELRAHLTGPILRQLAAAAM